LTLSFRTDAFLVAVAKSLAGKLFRRIPIVVRVQAARPADGCRPADPIMFGRFTFQPLSTDRD
jgi:hypothetical protein